MRNKNKLNIIILSLGIIFVLSIISNYNIIDDQMNDDRSMEIRDETNLKSPKKSGSWTPSFIWIDNNWSLSASNLDWVQGGDGSWGDPYIIENVTIDASSSPTGSGIFINNSKNDYFIIRNVTVYNAGAGEYDAGIKLENTNNGTLTNNNCSNNGFSGILLYNDSGNNTISGNTAKENAVIGIYLRDQSDNNTLSGNTVNNNTYGGIYLFDDCDNNIISGNSVSNNSDDGIYLGYYCDNNTISRNTVSNNAGSGIFLEVGNSDNTISGNIVNNNTLYGIYIYDDCHRNNINENYIYFNRVSAILTGTIGSTDNNITKNVMVSVDKNFILDTATRTFNELNFYLTTPPYLYVEIVNQSFSTTEFVIIINVFSVFDSFSWFDFNLSVKSIQMWWNGTAVPSNNIVELGNGLYNISLTPILVEPGENPILLNMTISATRHSNKYFELELAVDPEAVEKGPGAGPSLPGGAVGDDDDDDDDEVAAIPGPSFEMLLLIIGVAALAVVVVLVKKGIIDFSKMKKYN